MKKMKYVMLALMMAGSLTACKAKVEASDIKTETVAETTAETEIAVEPTEESKEETKPAAPIGMVNPFVTCKDMTEAKEKVGFDFTVPSMVTGVDKKIIRVNETASMIEVRYAGKEDEVTLRKAKSETAIDGVYTEYKEEKTMEVSGKEVLLRGEDGTYYVASWNDGEMAYAIVTDAPMTEAQMKEVAEKLR